VPTSNGEPVFTRELWGLQTARYKVPAAKFQATYGDQNRDSFASGLAASLAWLRFIGLDAGDLAARPTPTADGAAALGS
jgi:hypothetical protein